MRSSDILDLFKQAVNSIEKLSKPSKIKAITKMHELAYTLTRSLPQPQKLEILKLCSTLQNLARLPEGVPPLPAPDTSGKTYPIFAKRKNKAQSGVEYLQNHPLWSKMIPHFNPKIDRPYLFQDQLKALDPELYDKLVSTRTAIKKEIGISFKDLIPPKKVRNDLELEETYTSESSKGYYLNRARNKKDKN